MRATLIHPFAAHSRPAPSAPRRTAPLKWRMLAAVVLGAAIGVAAWTLTDRLTQRAQPPEAPAAVLPSPVTGDLMVRAEIAALQERLVMAGYAIPVTGVLDPVTKAAAADFMHPVQWQTLPLSLAQAMRGTVITGFRDPRAWNARFGLDRATRLVERPLKGPVGQLDANGNRR